MQRPKAPWSSLVSHGNLDEFWVHWETPSQKIRGKMVRKIANVKLWSSYTFI